MSELKPTPRATRAIGTLVAALFVFAALFLVIGVISFVFNQYTEMMKTEASAREEVVGNLLTLTSVEANYTFNEATGELNITITNNALEPVRILYVASSNRTHVWHEELSPPITLEPGSSKTITVSTPLRGKITVALVSDKGVIPAKKTVRQKLTVALNPVGLEIHVEAIAINHLKSSGGVTQVYLSSVIDTSPSVNYVTASVKILITPNDTITVYPNDIDVEFNATGFTLVYSAPNVPILRVNKGEIFEKIFTYEVDKDTLYWNYRGEYISVKVTIPLNIRGINKTLTVTLPTAFYVK